MSVFDRPTLAELLEAVIDFINTEIKSDSYPANKKFKFQIVLNVPSFFHNFQIFHINFGKLPVDQKGFEKNEDTNVFYNSKYSIVFSNISNQCCKLPIDQKA